MPRDRSAATTVPERADAGVVDALLVAAGGALGALLRAAVAGSGSPLTDLPGGATAIVNGSGALLLGALLAWLEARGPRPRWRAFLAVGLLGSFTTFSTLVDESARLAATRPTALARVGLSIAFGLVAFGAGRQIVRSALSRFAEPPRPQERP